MHEPEARTEGVPLNQRAVRSRSHRIVERRSAAADPLTVRLDADGFLLLDALFGPQELSVVWEELMRQFRTEAKQSGGSVSEIGTQQGSILELTRPTKRSAVLGESPVLQKVIEVSQRIFGGRVFCDFDHAILKPPHSGAPTAWHQDEAYHPMSSPAGTALRRLHWWIPLQDTAAMNGGMVYVPRSHLGGLHPHQRVTSSGGSVRRVMEPAENETVEATIRLGGAAIHLPRTIHMAQPNASGEARLAWIIQVNRGSPTLNAVRYGFRNLVDWGRRRAA